MECSPKDLSSPLPVVHVSASTAWTARSKVRHRVLVAGYIRKAVVCHLVNAFATTRVQTTELGPYGGYTAPCYKYRSRTGRHYIFSMPLPSKDHRAEHWTLRGVAVLAVGL